MSDDPVNHPKHYTAHPSGVECIQITEHMGFCLGNAVKYIWRADLKNDAIEDLKKARWYIDREIDLRERKATSPALQDEIRALPVGVKWGAYWKHADGWMRLYPPDLTTPSPAAEPPAAQPDRLPDAPAPAPSPPEKAQ